MPEHAGLLSSSIRPGMARVGVPKAGPPKGAPSIKQILKRFGAGKKRREMWEPQWREAFEYTMPNRNLFSNIARGSKRIPPTLFDSTAVKSVQRFAGRLQATLVPAFRQWITLEAGIDIPREQRGDINTALEEQTERLFEEIDASNLPQSINESFLDLSVGTGALVVRDEGNDLPINFISVPLSEFVVEEGPFGTIETQYRQWKLSVRNAVRLWPDNQLPADMQQNDTQLDKEVTVIEAVIYDAAARHYWKCAVMSAPKELWLQEPRASSSSGWAVFRWSKTSGEIWGRGPLLDLMPTIKTLNKVVEFTLRNAGLAIAGTYVADDQGVLNPYTFVLEAGAVNIVRNIDRIKDLPSSHDFNVSNLLASEMKQDIREGLFVDRLPDNDGAVRSATELVLRNKELLEDIGSSFGRLQAEMLFRIVQQTSAILIAQGKMAPISIDGKEVQVRYTGPLSRAQDLEEIENLRAYLEVVGGALGPEIMMLGTKVEELPEFVAEKLGVPTRLVRSAAERNELQQLALEAQQQQAQQAQPPAQGELEPAVDDQAAA